MKRVDVVFAIASVIYTIISLTLALISMAMVVYALWEIWTAIAANAGIIGKILDAIGLIVVAVAVFDVAKYLMEEEVLRDRELRSAREARRTLTKFIVIITIAVNLEALVFIFGAGSTDISSLVYPTALLAAGTLMVIGLGIFQRLSVSAEEKSALPTSENTSVPPERAKFSTSKYVQKRSRRHQDSA